MAKYHMLIVKGCHDCDGTTKTCGDPSWRQYHHWDFEVLCPAEPGDYSCAMWDPCGCKSEDPDDDIELQYEDCPKSPTGEHRWFSHFGLGCPTDQCFVVNNDYLPDAVSYLDIEVGRRYPVEFDVEDEVELYLEIVKEVVVG